MKLLDRLEFSEETGADQSFSSLIALIPSLDQKGRELAVRLLQLSRNPLLISDLIEMMAASGEFVNREVIALLASPPRDAGAWKWIESAHSHSLPEMRRAARLIEGDREAPYSDAA